MILIFIHMWVQVAIGWLLVFVTWKVFIKVKFLAKINEKHLFEIDFFNFCYELWLSFYDIKVLERLNEIGLKTHTQ